MNYAEYQDFGKPNLIEFFFVRLVVRVFVVAGT